VFFLRYLFHFQIVIATLITMFLSKFALPAIGFLRMSLQIRAHSLITSAVGLNGVIGRALGVPSSLDSCTDHNCDNDATIIRDREIKAGMVGACGRTVSGGNIIIERSIHSLNRELGGSFPEVKSGSSFSMIVHQMDAEGAGPYTCEIDHTGTGIAFITLAIQQNVPRSVSKVPTTTSQDYPLELLIPQGISCHGGQSGNIRLIRCRNNASTGPFGGCVPVQMTSSESTNQEATSSSPSSSRPVVLRRRSNTLTDSDSIASSSGTGSSSNAVSSPSGLGTTNTGLDLGSTSGTGSSGISSSSSSSTSSGTNDINNQFIGLLGGFISNYLSNALNAGSVSTATDPVSNTSGTSIRSGIVDPDNSGVVNPSSSGNSGISGDSDMNMDPGSLSGTNTGTTTGNIARLTQDIVQDDSTDSGIATGPQYSMWNNARELLQVARTVTDELGGSQGIYDAIKSIQSFLSPVVGLVGGVRTFMDGANDLSRISRSRASSS